MTPKHRRRLGVETRVPPLASPTPPPTAARIEEWKKWAAGKDRALAALGRGCLAMFAGIEVPPDPPGTVP